MAVLGNIVPIAVATASNWSSHRILFFIGAVASCFAPILVTALPDHRRTTRRVAAFAGIPALTMLQAYTGGAASGYSVLMMMAMVWFGLQASDREVQGMVAMLAACAFVPMLLVGAPAYPPRWGNGLLLVLVGSTVAASLRMAVREVSRLTKDLRAEAVMDPLTGLLNRRGWEQGVQAELARTRRGARHVTLVAFDLDGFKELNDASGHDEGDRVLREMAQRIRSTLRPGDILARLGGDEFAAVLSDSTAETASSAVQRLRAIDPQLVEFSAGIAVYDRRESLDELLRRADLALYAAKAGGGNRSEVAPRSLAADQAMLL